MLQNELDSPVKLVSKNHIMYSGTVEVPQVNEIQR